MSPTGKVSAGTPTRLRSFDPVRLADLEYRAWVGYYLRRWPRVLVASVGLVRAGFGMDWQRTLHGAWLVLRANQLWAPHPDNDPTRARACMRRFYALVRLTHGEPANPAKAAELEVDWWRVHREGQHRDGSRAADDAEPAEELVESLTRLYRDVIVGGRPGAAAGRTTFVALAARETHRFVLNPVFLFAVVITAWTRLADPPVSTVTDIDAVNPYPAILLGGFGMMAAFWLTRSMRASEPVAGVTPTMLPRRTAALCTVAIVPFFCGCLTLLAFLHSFPVGIPLYGAFSPPARIAVLVGQIVVPSLGGPLLGVALGRWVRFPGAAFVLFLILFGWGNLVTALSISRPDSTPLVALRLFAPFAFFTLRGDGANAHLTTWRGSPWFFIGWQLALCAIAVLVALLRGAEGPVRSRIIRALSVAGVAAVILLALASLGGFTHAVTA